MLTRFWECLLGMLGVLLLMNGVAGCERIDPSQELGQAWMDALNSHDPKRIVDLLQPTALCSDPMVRGALPPDAYGKWMSANWAIWKDRVYVTKRILTNASVIVIEWHIQQVHPNGTPVPLDGAMVLDVAGPLISGVRNYYSATAYVQFVKS